nr:MAG TPA: hypothetical protein [Caudoviricetes sp.]
MCDGVSRRMGQPQPPSIRGPSPSRWRISEKERTR